MSDTKNKTGVDKFGQVIPPGAKLRTVKMIHPCNVKGHRDLVVGSIVTIDENEAMILIGLKAAQDCGPGGEAIPASPTTRRVRMVKAGVVLPPGSKPYQVLDVREFKNEIANEFVQAGQAQEVSESPGLLKQLAAKIGR